MDELIGREEKIRLRERAHQHVVCGPTGNSDASAEHATTDLFLRSADRNQAFS
jgi:hypothetical protein